MLPAIQPIGCWAGAGEKPSHRRTNSLECNPPMVNSPPPTFLKPNELAKRWRLGRSTVYELIARGEFPYYRLGKTLRIALADVEAYEATGRVEAPVTPLR